MMYVDYLGDSSVGITCNTEFTTCNFVNGKGESITLKEYKFRGGS